MQINNSKSNTNFNGYKNVIANNLKKRNGECITFVSMQLNNNGTNDLKKWESIQKKLLNRDFSSDVITFSILKKDNDKVISLADNLIDTKNIPQGTKFEYSILSAIDLLASLTKRVKKDTNIPIDSEHRAMAYETKSDLLDIMLHNKIKEKELDRFVFGAYYAKILPQTHAKNINEDISDIMTKYFA